MTFTDYKKELKEKLWNTIDQLSDSEGFVLTATADDVTMTKLKAAGWDEHILEFEPMEHAQLQSWNSRLREQNIELQRESKDLAAKINSKKRDLKLIEDALAKVAPHQKGDHA